MPESSKARVRYNAPVNWNSPQGDRPFGFTYGDSKNYIRNWASTFCERWSLKLPVEILKEYLRERSLRSRNGND